MWSISTAPGHFPTSNEPKISPLPRAMAPFRQAHCRISVNGISGWCCCRHLISSAIERMWLDERLSVPMAILSPFFLISPYGARVSWMKMLDRGQVTQVTFLNVSRAASIDSSLVAVLWIRRMLS